jgi:hypothetical protein
MSVARPKCRMDIHVRRSAKTSDLNVQATEIATVDPVSGTLPISATHPEFTTIRSNYSTSASLPNSFGAGICPLLRAKLFEICIAHRYSHPCEPLKY